MPVPPTPLLFRNARQLLTLAGAHAPRRGKDLGEVGVVRRGSVLAADGKILQVGTGGDLDAEGRRLKARVIDCRGRVVMPGFVDSHTHLVFAGSRVEDYELRLRGKTYDEIAAAGGGIRLSARLLREASTGKLVAQARHFLDQFAAHGTTTVEVKSGYGLDFTNEMKTLQVVQRLGRHSAIELVPTLLAAHVLPLEFAGRASAYVDLIVNKLIPVVAGRKLAEYVDCFCDRGAFSVAQCRRVFEAGLRHGLVPRVHADQLTRTGASRLAVKLGAASADHLDWVTDDDVRVLAGSNVVATLLPGSNFHLGLRRFIPARRLVDAGAIVALATDFNPGTSPTPNMQMILSIACAALHLTPAEAISAATFNGAYALRRAHRLGSLEPDKQADLVVMDLDDYREISYYFGVNHCVMAVKCGRIIYQDR